MSNIRILPGQVEEKNLIKVLFDKLRDEQLYFEFSKITNGNREVQVKHFFGNDTQKAIEDSELGGYHFELSGQHFFFNYAEMLDLYVLLARIYQKDEPISEITEE